ncbi:MAG: DNA recombination protein RmuC [Alphaproteobacteria bacterium]|nr:DNA recombination protein RmuC [Alphaproteobacteria bacterium]
MAFLEILTAYPALGVAFLGLVFGIILQAILRYRLSKKLRLSEDIRFQNLSQLAVYQERSLRYSEAEEEKKLLSERLVSLEVENTELKSTIFHERQLMQEKLQLIEQSQLQLTETFKNLSNQALLANNQSFMGLAKSSFDKFLEATKSDMEQKKKDISVILEPVQKALGSVDEKIALLEKERVGAYSELKSQITDLVLTQKELRSETSNLVKALRTPAARGQWGEMQLRRVVEMAGMLSHCDFLEQVTTADGRLRPDMVINLPGNKKIIVDAKTPLVAYLEALETTDDAQRATWLEDHARHVRTHIRSLSQRAYWEQFQPTPEFVVMFLPGESFFSAALEKDPSLIEFGVKEKVILATPTTLIALLRAVAFGWRQEGIADNARAISELGRELHKRLGDMTQHFSRLGKQIHHVVESYNQSIGTFERRVLVSARKFNQLDPGLENHSVEMLNSLDSVPRSVQSIEVKEGADTLE